MTSPKHATTAKGGARFYTWQGERYWSVTTIINGGVPKRALINWAAKEVAEFAVDNGETFMALEREAAIDLLKRAPWRKRDKAADIGSSVHEAIEAYVLAKPMPEWPLPVKIRMEGFEQFLSDYDPVFEASEASVYNRKQHYAGTLDAIVRIDGRTLVLDAKSGKAIYPEVALQLAAYRHAEYIGLPDGTEAPMPKTDGGVALHLPNEGGYDLRAVHCDDSIFRAFLYCREVFRFCDETSKGVIGASVPLPGLFPDEAVELAKETA